MPPIHKEVTDDRVKYDIEPTAFYGNTLVCREPIERGQLVFVEPPLILLSGHYPEWHKVKDPLEKERQRTAGPVLSAVVKQVKELDAQQRAVFDSLSNSYRTVADLKRRLSVGDDRGKEHHVLEGRSILDLEQETKEILGRWMTNHFWISYDGLYGVWPTFARINHHCAPSAQAQVDDEYHLLGVRATRRLEVGEEITVTYTNIVHEHFFRQLSIETSHKFKCRCSECTKPKSSLARSDRNRRRIADFEKLFDRWSMGPQEGVSGKQVVTEGAALLCAGGIFDEEGLTAGGLRAHYWQLIQTVLMSHKKEAEAKRAVQHLIEELQIACGPYVADLERYRDQLVDPTKSPNWGKQAEVPYDPEDIVSSSLLGDDTPTDGLKAMNGGAVTAARSSPLEINFEQETHDSDTQSKKTKKKKKKPKKKKALAVTIVVPGAANVRSESGDNKAGSTPDAASSGSVTPTAPALTPTRPDDDAHVEERQTSRDQFEDGDDVDNEVLSTTHGEGRSGVLLVQQQENLDALSREAEAPVLDASTVKSDTSVSTSITEVPDYVKEEHVTDASLGPVLSVATSIAQTRNEEDKIREGKRMSEGSQVVSVETTSAKDSTPVSTPQPAAKQEALQISTPPGSSDAPRVMRTLCDESLESVAAASDHGPEGTSPFATVAQPSAMTELPSTALEDSTMPSAVGPATEEPVTLRTFPSSKVLASMDGASAGADEAAVAVGASLKNAREDADAAFESVALHPKSMSLDATAAPTSTPGRDRSQAGETAHDALYQMMGRQLVTSAEEPTFDTFFSSRKTGTVAPVAAPLIEGASDESPAETIQSSLPTPPTPPPITSDAEQQNPQVPEAVTATPILEPEIVPEPTRSTPAPASSPGASISPIVPGIPVPVSMVTRLPTAPITTWRRKTHPLATSTLPDTPEDDLSVDAGDKPSSPDIAVIRESTNDQGDSEPWPALPSMPDARPTQGYSGWSTKSRATITSKDKENHAKDRWGRTSHPVANAVTKPAMDATIRADLAKIESKVWQLPVSVKRVVISNIEHVKHGDPRLPLSCSWTMSFLDGRSAEVASSNKYQELRTYVLFTASTVPVFCGAFKSLARKLTIARGLSNAAAPRSSVEALRSSTSLCLFREHVEPKWEHEANQGGGRLVYNATLPKLALAFDQIALLLVGDTLSSLIGRLSGVGHAKLSSKGIIVGAVANRRARDDRLEVWVACSGLDRGSRVPMEWVRALRIVLASELAIPEGEIKWRPHKNE